MELRDVKTVVKGGMVLCGWIRRWSDGQAMGGPPHAHTFEASARAALPNGVF